MCVCVRWSWAFVCTCFCSHFRFVFIYLYKCLLLCWFHLLNNSHTLKCTSGMMFVRVCTEEDNKNEKTFNFFSSSFFRFFFYTLLNDCWMCYVCCVSHKFDFRSTKMKIECVRTSYALSLFIYTHGIFIHSYYFVQCKDVHPVTLLNHWFYVMGKKRKNWKFIFTFDNTSFAGPFLISLKIVLCEERQQQRQQQQKTNWQWMIHNH